MSLQEKVFPVFEKYFFNREKLIVGVSGGPDSTALFHLLIEFSREYPREIFVAHVNHGIRGKDSLRDEASVKKLAKKYGVKCFIKRIKLAGNSFEEKGRNARRDFFEALRKRFRAQWIMTAHTQDDQIETILFNFIRGSGPSGLAGMKTKNGFYLKPLLGVSKKEILEYLRQGKFDYSIDYTNDYTKYSRNFIRKNVIPLLKRINPNFQKTIIANAAIFSEFSVWLQASAEKFLKENQKGKIIFSLKAFQELPEILKFSVIQEAYLRNRATSYRLPISKVQAIRKMIEHNIGNKKIECPKGRFFTLKKGLVAFK